MKQIRGSKNCVVVVASMATGLPIDDFESSMKANPDGSYTDYDFAFYMINRGYVIGVGSFKPQQYANFNDNKEIIVSFKINDYPAYVVVESETGNDTHVIYWNKEKVYDPNPDVEDGRPLDDYKIISWYPINRKVVEVNK